MKRTIILLSILLAATVAVHAATKASSLTSNYITWTFDKEYPVGQFVTGDWYVIGDSVKIIAIDNSLSDKSFMPTDPDVAVHGAMVNPVVDKTAPRNYEWQGYDSRISGYKPEWNAARPNDKPLSKDNPLVLKPNESLISQVSWLWRTNEDREPGCPGFGSGPKDIPRPSQRSGAVLTVLAAAPPEGSFRPSYAGTEKRMFNVSQLKRDRLANLAPVAPIYAGTDDPYDVRRSDRYPSWSKDKNDPPSDVPGRADEHALYWSYLYGADIALLTQGTSRPWIDHLPDWFAGTFLKPSINVSNYGREMCCLLETAMLALHTDWSKIEGAPKSKDKLLNNMVQIGIDYAGCCDAGTWYPANGGHHGGRKPAILFAGLLLDDPHMKNVGHWDTDFHDNGKSMYVTQEMVDKSRSPGWRPDPRGTHLAPYSEFLIGMPEWEGSNAGWDIPYRGINEAFIVGFALTFYIMEDGRKLFNHEAYFDYADRSQSRIAEATKHMNASQTPKFVTNMWNAYRKNYPSTYDKKWDDDKVIDWCTTPVFTLKSAAKAYGLFELKDEEPIRMTVGIDVDLSKVTPETVTFTSSEGQLPIKAIEIAENPGKFFVIRFADGVQLKPGSYQVTLDESASAEWRNGVGMKLFSNKAEVKVR